MTRRARRVKARTQPLTDCQWRFFLSRSMEDFDQLNETHPEEFFVLFFQDGWRSVYAAHRETIEHEWGLRERTAEQKKFVLTEYLAGDFLKNDRERHERLELFNAWKKSGQHATWEDYLTPGWEKPPVPTGFPG